VKVMRMMIVMTKFKSHNNKRQIVNHRTVPKKKYGTSATTRALYHTYACHLLVTMGTTRSANTLV